MLINFAKYFQSTLFPQYIKDLDLLKFRLPIDLILYRGGCRNLEEISGPTSFSYSPTVAKTFCKGSYYKIIFPKGTAFLPIFLCSSKNEKEILILEPGRLIQLEKTKIEEGFFVLESFFQPDISRSAKINNNPSLIRNLIEEENRFINRKASDIIVDGEVDIDLLGILLFNYFYTNQIEKESNLTKELFNIRNSMITSTLISYFVTRRIIDLENTDILLKNISNRFFKKVLKAYNSF